jgi:hypothetical protein
MIPWNILAWKLSPGTEHFSCIFPWAKCLTSPTNQMWKIFWCIYRTAMWILLAGWSWDPGDVGTGGWILTVIVLGKGSCKVHVELTWLASIWFNLLSNCLPLCSCFPSLIVWGGGGSVPYHVKLWDVILERLYRMCKSLTSTARQDRSNFFHNYKLLYAKKPHSVFPQRLRFLKKCFSLHLPNDIRKERLMVSSCPYLCFL